MLYKIEAGPSTNYMIASSDYCVSDTVLAQDTICHAGLPLCVLHQGKVYISIIYHLSHYVPA